MKFLRIRVQRFGPLEGIDSGVDSALPDLVAVLGPNEAGKSAFHQLLEAVLYGFHPATADQNPFAPWNGGDIDFTAELELRQGPPISVRRRLLKTPRTEVTRGNELEKLDNRALSAVGSIGRKVFSEVYAITLSQLTGLRETAWETVQEQLVVGMGAQDLRSSREAIRGFREAAKKIWQPSKRGKQLHRQLRAELAELGQSRREAQSRAKELRQLGAELVKLDSQLEAVSEAHVSRTKELRVLRELLPLKIRLDKLDKMEKSLGNRKALSLVPKDPVGKHRELDDRLNRAKLRLDELAKSRHQVDSSAPPPSELELKVLDRAPSLRALASNAPLVHERAGRQADLVADVAALEGKIREASLPLLGIWSAEAETSAGEDDPADWLTVGEGFLSLDMAALRQRVEEAEAERRRREGLEERLEQASSRSSIDAPMVSFWVMLFAAAAAGVVLGGAVIAEPVVSMIGAALVLISAGLLARSWSRRSVARQIHEAGLDEEHELESQMTDARGKERLAVASARTLLIPLGLQPSRLDAPSGSLVGVIGEVKSLFHSRQDRLSELGRLRDEVALFDQEFEQLVPDLGLELPEDRSLALIELGQKLLVLDERRVRAEETESAKIRSDTSLERERKEHDELIEMQRDFVGRVEKAGATVDAEGLQALAGQLADLERFAGLREDFEREVGDILDLRQRISLAEVAGEDWTDPSDRIAESQKSLESGERETNDLREKRVRLTERGKVLSGEDTPDLVDGHILDLQAQIREVERKRDLGVVLARLLEHAEARFRSTHQPDLLRRAEHHLSTITSGRYERILIGEIGDDRGFFLDAPHLPEPIPVAAPLSTGTREQAYLALRLAIVEHLDGDSEALPLLMDETLVNWDPERRKQVLDLLAGVAPLRQIFLFTCHPHIAKEVADRGGMVLELDAS